MDHSRKPSWKERLTSVSKVFGVSSSPTRQQYSARDISGKDRRGEGKREVGNGRVDQTVDAADEWCVLDVNGSDLSDAVVGRDNEDRVCLDKVDGVLFYKRDTDLEALEMEHTDGLGLLDRFRGAKKGDSGKSSTTGSGSPPASGGLGSRKSSFGSRLRASDVNKVTRPGSPQPLQRRSSGRGRPKLDPYDHANGHASPRSTSPSRSSSSGSTRRKQSSSNPPSRTESPNLPEPRKHDVHSGLHVKQTHHQNGGKNGRGSPAISPSSGTGESAFDKVRDTLRISKTKNKRKKKKSTAYSVDPVEINFPPSTKYQDPYEAHPSFTDSLDVPSKEASHDFKPVSIPHNKPEYCDHCSETAWGLYRQVLKCSSKFFTYYPS